MVPISLDAQLQADPLLGQRSGPHITRHRSTGWLQCRKDGLRRLETSMIVARKPSISSEVLRFATVGLTATLVYFVAFNVVSYGTAFSPVIANIVAFGLSLAVSYLGHKH